jgi:hypothetical protein
MSSHQAPAGGNQDKKTIANTMLAMIATDEMLIADALLDVDAAAPADVKCVAPVDLPVVVAPPVGVGRAV